MNELTLRNFNGIDVVDSRQVAEAVGKTHKELLRDIRKYCDYLTERKIAFTEKSNDFNERKIAPVNESKIACVDFFIESTYIDNKGEKRACYLCTRKGCEMIANKLTGKTFTEIQIQKPKFI